jgi:predicted nucleic acid-binding protein
VIFVDTSFWISVNARRDRRHETAVELLRRHGEGRLLTSNHVIGELWTFLRGREGHAVALRAVERLRASDRVEISFAGVDVEAESWAWLERHDEQEYSFVDAVSFALMRRLAISDVLTFDRDFAAAGFVPLAL